jgi:hypothetical protein
MPPVGFEPMISAGERPQTYALDSAATGTDINNSIHSLTRRNIDKYNAEMGAYRSLKQKQT